MIINFKNGYKVKVVDKGNLSNFELIRAAKEAVKQIHDAELTRNPVTNVSFQITNLKEAIRNKDEKAIDREINFLMRDLRADASESHKNYPKIYRKELIEKILKSYEQAQDVLFRAGGKGPTKEIADLIAEIRKNWDMVIPDTFSVVLEPIDGNNVKYGTFDTEEEAEKFVEDISKKPMFSGQAYVLNNMTGEVGFIKMKTPLDDKAPYYDPTDYAKIESDYSSRRLEKEIRHSAETGANLEEFDEVISEIDNFISQGRDALVKAGWTKDDARHAINEHYRELLRQLRKYKLNEKATTLAKKIRELEKAWDLRT